MTRTGRQDFTGAEVLNDLLTVGTPYAENTIKTMISAHLVYDGTLERVARGVYRVAASAGRPAAVATRNTNDGPGVRIPVPAVGSSAHAAPPAAQSGVSDGTCQGCGKGGLITNTMCRKCRNGGTQPSH